MIVDLMCELRLQGIELSCAETTPECEASLAALVTTTAVSRRDLCCCGPPIQIDDIQRRMIKIEQNIMHRAIWNDFYSD